MNVESVSWAAARSSVLYPVFFLLALIFYLRKLKTRNLPSGRPGLKLETYYSFFFFLLACFSKSSAVILPLVLLLLDWYFGRKLTVKVFTEKIPFFFVSIIFGITAIYASDEFGSLGVTAADFSFFDRLFMVGYALLFYPFKLLFPVQLSAIHYNPVKVDGWMPIAYYIAPIVLAILIWLVYRFRHKKEIIFGTLFYLINIILVSQVVSLGNTIVSERYFYVPAIGLFFVIGSLLNEGLNRTKLKPLMISGLIAATVMFSFISWKRTQVWNSGLAIFTDVIEKYPNGPDAYYGRGIAKTELGNLKGAIADYNKAIVLHPEYAVAYGNRAGLKVQMGDASGALHDYDTAIKFDRAYFAAIMNRGQLKSQLADYRGAIADYEIAIQLNPENPLGYHNRGAAKAKIGDYEGAITDYKKALVLNVELAETYAAKGNTEFLLNKMPQACSDWKKAVELGYKSSEKLLKEYCVNP